MIDRFFPVSSKMLETGEREISVKLHLIGIHRKFCTQHTQMVSISEGRFITATNYGIYLACHCAPGPSWQSLVGWVGICQEEFNR